MIKLTLVIVALGLLSFMGTAADDYPQDWLSSGGQAVVHYNTLHYPGSTSHYTVSAPTYYNIRYYPGLANQNTWPTPVYNNTWTAPVYDNTWYTPAYYSTWPTPAYNTWPMLEYYSTWLKPTRNTVNDYDPWWSTNVFSPVRTTYIWDW